jgi:MoaA/NifB/PqqE/SkfB family radical SAM enzyme
MGFAELAQRSFGMARPFGAHLELTYACTWRCVFCYNPRHHDVRRLSAEEWGTVIGDLRQLGTLQVTLTGGEPLAHPEFFTIARLVRDQGLVLRLFTNGQLVDGPEVAARIGALDPLSVELSLHGAEAVVHDRTTGRPGSFDALWRAVGFLKAAGVKLQLKSPVTRINEHQLDDMIEQVAAAGVPYRLDTALTPRDDGDRGPLAFTASEATVRRVLDFGLATGGVRVRTRKAGEANCGLGRASVTVDPEGNVYPCMQWRHTSFGNVRLQRLKDMWPASPERKRLAELAVRANDRLVQDEDAHPASFCPALAFGRSGSATEPDAPYLRASSLLASVLRARQVS